MRFDAFGDEPGGGPVEQLPDGDHEVEIAKVKTVTVKADGTDRTVLTLAATTGDFEPVEKWLNPRERRDCQAAIQLLAALGLPADTDIDDGIVGRRVVITTKAGTNKKTGMPVVYVNAFAEVAGQPAPKPAKPTARRSPAARTTDPDDIPF